MGCINNENSTPPESGSLDEQSFCKLMVVDFKNPQNTHIRFNFKEIFSAALIPLFSICAEKH